MSNLIGSSWDLSGIWNEALVTIPERPLQKRSYIYASELGGSYIDRYLKMYAVPATNPPNERSLRKFSAGHVFEWIVGAVMTMTGIIKAKQLRGEYAIKDCIPVAGKLDFVAGGQIDWDFARKEVERLKAVFSVSNSDMPPMFFHAANKILDYFQGRFSASFPKEVVFECKSVSSFMSDKLERTNKPMPHHQLQCLHYLLANEMDEAYLGYVSKDDMKMFQFSIFVTPELLRQYANDVETMTGYYNEGFNPKNVLKKAPPKELEVTYDPETGRFNTNYKVEYSNYLSLIYGYKSPKEYRDTWDSRVSSWNRVFKRIVTGENITAKNKDIILDAKQVFPNFEELAEQAKANGIYAGVEEELIES